MFSSNTDLHKYILTWGFALALLAPAGAAQAQSLSVIHKFSGTDGEYPRGSLLLGKLGTLYGTTTNGGTGCSGSGCGTVFKIAAGGTESVLYYFSGNDGAEPTGGVVMDAAGNLYGTTFVGGGQACEPSGCGTVFKLAKDGTETVLYSFKGGSDGAGPASGLLADKSGNLYGTTVGGGTDCNGAGGCGTVFKVTPDGTETVLYIFKGGNDGFSPQGGLIMDAAGNLYGTTFFGGGSGGQVCGSMDCGTVFKLAPDGTETILHSFDGVDGSEPTGTLLMDGAANLFGTTESGGTKEYGTVFELAPDGTETMLHSFTGGSDGIWPGQSLVSDRSDNLYGTTFYGGNNACSIVKQHGKPKVGCGTVFKLAKDGTETVLFAFDRPGRGPIAGVIADKHGNLYGSTLYGDSKNCAYGCGTLFKLTP